RQINLLGGNEKAIIPSKTYPLSDVRTLEIKGNHVIQIAYDGLLPLYIDNTSYKQAICDYYFDATLCSYDFSGMEDYYNKPTVIFFHYYDNKIIRDYDNRNYKYILDAIRHTRIMEDDNWQSMSTADFGFVSDINAVYVYICEEKKLPNVLSDLFENHEQYKEGNMPVISKEKFIENHQKKYGKSSDFNEKESKYILDMDDDIWNK